MEAKSIVISAISAVLMIADADAQKIWEQRKGCVRSQGNLAGGYIFPARQVGAYLTGDMDLFIDNRVSVTGSTWISFALTRKHQPGIKANHAILGGMAYHFTKKGRFDPYIGFTPGLGLVSVAYKEGDELKRTPVTPVPLLSASAGFNYYIGSVFHFFVKAQGISGQMLQHVPAPARLEELKFTAGLGWNFRLWKPKVKSS